MDVALNSRELAALLWLAAALFWGLSNHDMRASIWGVVTAFLQPKLLLVVIAMAGYVVGLIVLGSLVGLWDAELLSDSVVWFVFSALGLLFGSSGLADDSHFWRRTLTRAVAVTVLVEGFINLYVFGLLVELVLFPVLLFLVLMAAVAETKEEYAPVTSVVNGLLSFIALGLALYVAARLIRDGGAGRSTIQRLVLPIWLTLGLLPFIYASGIYGAYESTFLRMEWLSDDRRATTRAKIALLLGVGLRPRHVSDFVGPWPSRLVEAPSFRAARGIVSDFEVAKREEDLPRRPATSKSPPAWEGQRRRRRARRG